MGPAVTGAGGSAPLGADVEIGVARAVASGERVSGDDHVAVPCRDGMLVAAIDGLGHGAAAGEAAQRAARVLREHSDEPLPRLVERCHDALADTRGAALTVARIDARRRTLEWLGVGNVAGRVVHADPAAAAGAAGVSESALLLGGVVGDKLPPLRPVTLPLLDGDTLLLATDGVDPDIGVELRLPGALAALADGLLQRHRRSTGDDALVLLARFHGAK